MWVENSESLYRRLRGLRLYRIKCTSETKLSASYFSSFTARLPYGRLLAATMSAAEMLTAKWPGAAPRVHTGLGGPFLGPPAGADPGGGLLSAPPPVTVVRAGDTSGRKPWSCLPTAASGEGKNVRVCHCKKTDLGSACAADVLLLGGFIRKVLGLDLYFQSSFSPAPPFLSLHSVLQGLQNLWSDPSLTFPGLFNQAACPPTTGSIIIVLLQAQANGVFAQWLGI